MHLLSAKPLPALSNLVKSLLDVLDTAFEYFCVLINRVCSCHLFDHGFMFFKNGRVLVDSLGDVF